MSKDEAMTNPTPAGALQVHDYGQDAGKGFSGTDGADFAIPFIAILQSNSPQIADETERIKGAVPGMLYNTVNNRVIDGKVGFVFVPCHTEHVFTEWTPRDKGGGFAGRHEIGSAVVADAISSGKRSEKGNRPLLDNGNELAETFYMYGLILDEAGAPDFSEMAVLAFTSTKIKKYKKAMTTLRTCKAMNEAPLFAHQLRVKTVQETNVHGTFYNFMIEPAINEGDDPVVASAISPQLGDDPHPVLVAGRKLEEQVVGGAGRPAYDSQSGEAAGSKDDVF